ncbi:ABC transporter permease subunit [Paenibacillus sp. P22]|uniref:ABC transporter permease subunit n=1 Tax=Paenibacillus sp. P22 TaxID=483908 RepID=UPI00069ED8C9|nr:ABC transporter permease subunit [Paenibacillus sp. P22]
MAKDIGINKLYRPEAVIFDMDGTLFQTETLLRHDGVRAGEARRAVQGADHGARHPDLPHPAAGDHHSAVCHLQQARPAQHAVRVPRAGAVRPGAQGGAVHPHLPPVLPRAAGQLEEAAKLDGASSFRLFFRIMLPLAQSACLVVFLFSFIWYWNMYYEPSMFLANGFTPLSIRLDNLEDVLNPSLLGNTHFITNPVTEGTKMAAAFLIILPPLILFMVLQRWFVAGIERTGIVE